MREEVQQPAYIAWRSPAEGLHSAGKSWQAVVVQGSPGRAYEDVQGSSRGALIEVSDRLHWSLSLARQVEGEGATYMFPCLSIWTRENP